jgi:hypothetical protein
MGTVLESHRETIRLRKTMAYWYAVGHADATGEEDRAEEFAKFAESEATAYYDDDVEVYSLKSVPDQWKVFNRSVSGATP